MVPPTAPSPKSAGRSSSRSAASGSRSSLPAELSLGGGGGGGGGAARKKAPRRSGGGSGGAAVSGDALTAPMQGTIVKIAVEDGQTVDAGSDLSSSSRR